MFTMEESATHTDATATNGSATANDGGGFAASGGGSAATKNEKAKPSFPKLTGKHSYIKILCESQRPSLGKVMAEHGLAMFKMSREIAG